MVREATADLVMHVELGAEEHARGRTSGPGMFALLPTFPHANGDDTLPHIASPRRRDNAYACASR